MEQTTKKSAGRPKKTTTASATVEKIIEKTAKSKKERLKLEDYDELSVKSNVFGQLIYINHKTGDETRWDNHGEVQTLTVRDLRDMKAKQLSFFKENWISIVDSPDVDLDVYSLEDIYEALQIKNYYKNTAVPENLDDFFDWNADKIRKNYKLMPPTIRETLVIRANDKIKDGSLDSISKVKLLEEVFNCELTSPED